jgi:glycosyltransferase 2 family protein
MAEALGRSDRRGRIVGIAGAVVGLGAGALVVRELVDQWDATVEAVRGADPAWLVVAAVAGGAGMVAIAWVWSAVLGALGEDVARGRAVRWYFLGELGKYLPGGVWTVVGRAELARRGGVARPVAYGSVAVSLVALYLAAALVAAVVVPFDLARQRDDPRVAVAAAVVIAGGIVVLHPRTLRALLDLGRRVTGRELAVPLPDGRRTAGLVLRYVPAWIGIAVATWAIARALDPDAPIARVALATVVSWIAGFLAVPVPAGGGIREAVFLAVAGLPLGVGAATALAARVLFVAVDGLGALAAGATTRRGGVPGAGEQD